MWFGFQTRCALRPGSSTVRSGAIPSAAGGHTLGLRPRTGVLGLTCSFTCGSRSLSSTRGVLLSQRDTQQHIGQPLTTLWRTYVRPLPADRARTLSRGACGVRSIRSGLPTVGSRDVPWLSQGPGVVWADVQSPNQSISYHWVPSLQCKAKTAGCRRGGGRICAGRVSGASGQG